MNPAGSDRSCLDPIGVIRSALKSRAGAPTPVVDVKPVLDGTDDT